MILKHTPEDFIVEEVHDRIWDDDGPYAIFKLSKISLDTLQAVDIITKRFHLNQNDIKFCGTKDKHAKTTQFISIPSRKGISSISLDEDNLKLEHVGYSAEPLNLGNLKGNRFMITVREITDGQSSALKRNLAHIEHIKHEKGFIVPNYFDEQRFSSNNYNIGLSILKKEYKKAVGFICESGDFYSESAKVYLAANPNDYVSVIKHIPKKTLLMFIHSVQSYFFNEALSSHLSKNAQDKSIVQIDVPYSLGTLVYYQDTKLYPDELEKIPLIGFDTLEYPHSIRKIMLKEGITPRDFIVRAIPELSVEGTLRECFIDVKDLDVKILDDRVIASFELTKGSYATNVIKALFN